MRTTALIFALLLLPACAAFEQKTSDADLVERTVDTPRLLELMRNRSRPVALIDVRSEADFVAGHLPGAINIPLPRITAGDPRLAEAHTLIVYGDGWTDILTPAAAKKLIDLKYNNVYAYRGGVELWTQEKREIVTATP